MAEQLRFSAPHPLGLPATQYSHPIRMLGKGAFGEVYLCFLRRKHPTGVQYEPVAVKVFQPLEPSNGRLLTMLRREVLCQRELNHPHVIGLREVGITESEKRIYLNLEYADSGNLKQLLAAARGGRLTEGEARWYTQQLVYGMAYCHAKGVFNRDIKPENLLLHRGGLTWPLLKVSDFGLCKSTLLFSAPRSLVGSFHYMAPEVIMRIMNSAGSGHDEYDGRKVDVFSCGIVLYQMMFGTLPFNRAPDGRPLEYKFREDREIILENMQLERWPQLIPQSSLTPHAGAAQQQQPANGHLLAVPPNPALLDLLKGMLRCDPCKRITLRDVMLHPWYRHGLPDEYHQMLLNVDTDVAPGEASKAYQTEEEIAELFKRLEEHMKAQEAATGSSEDDDG